jgi:hypothetical protein
LYIKDSLTVDVYHQSSLVESNLIGSICGIDIQCKFIYKFLAHRDPNSDGDTDQHNSPRKTTKWKKDQLGGRNFDDHEDETGELSSNDQVTPKDSKPFRINQSVSKHPYFSLTSVPNMILDDNEGHLLILWLELCCLKFFQKSIGAKELTRRVPGRIGNDHYVFDFVITKRSEPILPVDDQEDVDLVEDESENSDQEKDEGKKAGKKKKKQQLRHFLVINLYGQQLQGQPGKVTGDGHIFGTEFCEDDAYLFMQLLRKANQVYSP